MKDFLNYLLTIPQRIGIYFAKRAARIEKRRAQEHARKVELAKAYEPLLSTAIMGFVAVLSKVAEIEAAKRTKFPPGGIVRPDFPANDDREWFAADTSPERMKALLKFEEPTPEQNEAIQRQNAENIRKSAEMWRKFKDPKKPNLYPAEE